MIDTRLKFWSVTAIATVAFAVPAAAQQQEPVPARAADVPVGDTTRSLLEIQRNGAQAGQMHPLTGDQATLSYVRYMRSFEHSLPAFFTTMATGSPLRGDAGSPQANNGQ